MQSGPQTAHMVIADRRGDRGQCSVAVWVGRHSCMVPGHNPLLLPFLKNDGKFPVVFAYGLSILLDTATT